MEGKAAGPDGIPTALLKPTLPAAPYGTPAQEHDPALPTAKDAIMSLAACLHLIFTAIAQSKQVPDGWHTALLTPIYKGKGQLADLSSYRPLSVPSVLCRVWSSVINQRLLQATKHILPDTMFGFRPHRRTADALFVLRHLIDMQRAGQGNKFGAAFMDLSGAYDSVDRNLLFIKLQSLGMSQHTLGTLRHLYSRCQCITKCKKGTHAAFAVNIGLRQGCPLSTTLFNLYIWDLHQRLQQAGPQ
jgi:hypothetical protein